VARSRARTLGRDRVDGAAPPICQHNPCAFGRRAVDRDKSTRTRAGRAGSGRHTHRMASPLPGPVSVFLGSLLGKSPLSSLRRSTSEMLGRSTARLYAAFPLTSTSSMRPQCWHSRRAMENSWRLTRRWPASLASFSGTPACWDRHRKHRTKGEFSTTARATSLDGLAIPSGGIIELMWWLINIGRFTETGTATSAAGDGEPQSTVSLSRH
jgi:hypothetical protein